MSSVAAAGAAQRRPVSRAAGRSRADALHAPEHDTLLITVDRLTPVPDILGVFHTADVAVPVSTRLHLLTLDRLGLLEQAWRRFADILAETTRHSKLKLPAVDTLAAIDAAELTSLPGIEEFLLLRRIRDEAVGGTWQRIVVDLSGCGDPFAFLRSASVLSQALGRMWPRHRRLAAAAERPVLAQVSAAVDAIDSDCVDVAGLLADAHAVAAHMVVGCDDRALRVLPHYLAGADLTGLPLRSVYLNDGVGPPSATPVPDEVAALAGDTVAVHRVPAADDPLDRPARLRRLGVTLAAPDGRAHGSVAARVESVPLTPASTDSAPTDRAAVGSGAVGSGAADSAETDRAETDSAEADSAETGSEGTDTDRGYELTWTQRLPDPASLSLGRSGDDLLVTVGGLRYPVRLPSVLRRCDVVDAQWADDLIRIRFRPNPAVWPRH